MKKIVSILSILASCIVVTHAQIAVKVSPLKAVGQRALVQLTITNRGTNTIDAARAVCFVTDKNGRMLGQSTKWVIGQNKKSLEPNGQSKFNFVISTPHPVLASNLTANVSFTRLILQGGKPANPHEVLVIPATKPSNRNAKPPLFGK